MIKTISDGYIVAILKEGDTDSEYDRLSGIMKSAGVAEDGYMYMMKEDESIVKIALSNEEPEVDSDTVVSELREILGVV